MNGLRLKSIFNLGLLFGFPLFLVVCIGWFIIPFKSIYLREIIAFGMMTSIGYSLMFLFRSKKTSSLFFFVFYFMLSLLVIIKLNFYYHYKVKLSASALFVIFETNKVEAKDFLYQYFD